MTQLAAQHCEEINRLKDEFSRDLQEGMEAAHQAELLHSQVPFLFYYTFLFKCFLIKGFRNLWYVLELNIDMLLFIQKSGV